MEPPESLKEIPTMAWADVQLVVMPHGTAQRMLEGRYLRKSKQHDPERVAALYEEWSDFAMLDGFGVFVVDDTLTRMHWVDDDWKSVPVNDGPMQRAHVGCQSVALPFGGLAWLAGLVALARRRLSRSASWGAPCAGDV